MKRRSDVLYTFLEPQETHFSRTPCLNFGSLPCSPRLVDYSFTDVSDNEEEHSYSCGRTTDPLQELQSELAMLVSRAHSAQKKRAKTVRRSRSTAVREQTSLRLKTEEYGEKLRKEALLERLHGSSKDSSTDSLRRKLFKKTETSGTPAKHVVDSGRPSKKPRLELKMLRNISKSRSSIRRTFKSVKQEVVVPDAAAVVHDCLFSFLTRRR